MIDNMDRFNKLYSLLSSKLYPMRFGNDLTDSLMYLPEYSDSIRSKSKPTRLTNWRQIPCALAEGIQPPKL